MTGSDQQAEAHARTISTSRTLVEPTVEAHLPVNKSPRTDLAWIDFFHIHPTRQPPSRRNPRAHTPTALRIGRVAVAGASPSARKSHRRSSQNRYEPAPILATTLDGSTFNPGCDPIRGIAAARPCCRG
jgi:hypothetical protein